VISNTRTNTGVEYGRNMGPEYGDDGNTGQTDVP
jgi:hypothetical protein